LICVFALPVIPVGYFLGCILFKFLCFTCVTPSLELHDVAEQQALNIDFISGFIHAQLYEGTHYTEEVNQNTQGFLTSEILEKPILSNKYFVNPTHINSVFTCPGYIMLPDNLENHIEEWYESHPPVKKLYHYSQSSHPVCRAVWVGIKRKTWDIIFPRGFYNHSR
jgi:hypothetical protein